MQTRPLRPPVPVRGWAPHHVGGAAYSCTVAPGPIETERTAKNVQELREMSDYSPHRLVPMRRTGQPREIAECRYLPCLPGGGVHHRPDAERRWRAMIPR
jgi:NAD(P)-dependent dehydrogenase (short-subunit alcohol dehydrogenase family)